MENKVEIYGNWLKTQSGNYVNLKKVAIFQKFHQHNKGYFVQAIFQSSYGVDGNVLFETLGEFQSVEQAQKYMDKIIEEMNCYGNN